MHIWEHYVNTIFILLLSPMNYCTYFDPHSHNLCTPWNLVWINLILTLLAGGVHTPSWILPGCSLFSNKFIIWLSFLITVDHWLSYQRRNTNEFQFRHKLCTAKWIFICNDFQLVLDFFIENTGDLYRYDSCLRLAKHYNNKFTTRFTTVWWPIVINHIYPFNTNFHDQFVLRFDTKYLF